VLFPTANWIRKYVLSTERTLLSARWFRSYTLVVVKVFSQHNLLALVVHFVLIRVLALLNQMLVQLRNFYNLFTLPACRQHRTLLPIVKIDWLRIKWFIVSIAKVANLVFCGSLFLWNWLGLHLRLLLFLGSRQLFLFLLWWLFKASCTLWIYIRSDVNHWLFFFNFSFWLIKVCF
jgi:hypothetical protein